MATLLAGGLPCTASALEPTCERYLASAEKSAAQPAVHTVTETGGTRIESIAVGGKAWSRMDGGAWTPLPANVRALGRQMAADMRAGRLPLRACKVTGTETVAGTPTTVISYALDVGTGPQVAKAYIGRDGLVHAQSTDDAKVRFRYRDVVAPKP